MKAGVEAPREPDERPSAGARRWLRVLLVELRSGELEMWARAIRRSKDESAARRTEEQLVWIADVDGPAPLDKPAVGVPLPVSEGDQRGGSTIA